jgi:hypothetical protein
MDFLPGFVTPLGHRAARRSEKERSP